MIDGMINSTQPASPAATRVTGPPGAPARAAPEESGAVRDAVDLSPAARDQMEQGDTRPIRLKMVERVRAEIAAGAYLTDEKIDAVVNKLHAEFAGAA